MFDKEGVAARSIEDFELTFSGARGKQLISRRRGGSDDFARRLRTYKSISSPSDEGLGSSISGTSETGLAKSFDRALDLVSDSALGTSIGDGSIKEEELAVHNTALPNIATEDDSLFAEDLIQGWLARRALMNSSVIDSPTAGITLRVPVPRQTRQRGIQTRNPTTSASRSAVTQSISPQTNIPFSRQPCLSGFARKQVEKNILDPILREARFNFFHPLVSSLGSNSNKTIKCLRDLEQSLIFAPLVSSIFGLDNSTTVTDIAPCYPQTLAVSQHLYRTFGEFSIQLVVDTYHHLSEPEQRRAADRPYDNGYFLDLVQQVGRLAAQIGRTRQGESLAQQAQEPEQDEMAYSSYVSFSSHPINYSLPRRRDDEVTLEGGLCETGELAELVRWKNGKGISLRTNEPYEPLPGIKRQHSSESLDDDVERSMARRKKNAEPNTVQLKCSDKTCGKIFTRRCDLAKHQKTHSRPFKCPEKTCKYHEEGLPTEKERDRHINDKHSANPHFYECQYRGCDFKTKRESNCKQHMEKKHGYKYERAKGSSRIVKTPGQTPQTPNMDYSPSTESVAPSYTGWSGSSASGSVAGSTVGTPHEQALDFAGFRGPMQNMSSSFSPNVQERFGASIDGYHFGVGQLSLPQQSSLGGYPPTYTTSPMTPQFATTPMTPAGTGVNSYDQSPYMDSYNIGINMSGRVIYDTGLPTPGSTFLQPTSRNPSISYESPLVHQPMEQTFPAPSAPYHAADVTFTNPPVEDFDLYDGAGNPALFPSTADISSAGGEMFPPMDDDMMYSYEDDSGALIDDFLNADHV